MLPLAAVQSIANQVNHSLSGVGIRKWEEMGEERERTITREWGHSSPRPLLGLPDIRLGLLEAT